MFTIKDIDINGLWKLTTMLRCPKKQLIKLCWNRHPLNKCQLSTFPRYCIGTESIQSVTYGFCPPWVYKQLLIGLVSLKPPCGDKWQKQNAGSHWSCQKGFSFESHSPECVAFLVAQLVKESTCSVEDLGLIPGWECPLRKRTATQSSILACRIPWAV